MFNTYGFKNVYMIDIGASIMYYQKRPDYYFDGECYNNAYRCLQNNIGAKNKTVYGYVLSSNDTKKVAVRHCWNIINTIPTDVTMLANDINPISLLNFAYLPIVEFNMPELLKAVVENNYLPALPIFKKERYYIKKLKEKGFEIIA